MMCVLREENTNLLILYDVIRQLCLLTINETSYIWITEIL